MAPFGGRVPGGGEEQDALAVVTGRVRDEEGLELVPPLEVQRAEVAVLQLLDPLEVDEERHRVRHGPNRSARGSGSAFR